MKKILSVASLALLFVGWFALPLRAADAGNLVKFKGGIGVTPVSSGVGTANTAEVVNRNIVREVQPPGQIWVIKDLDAHVRTNGDIKIKGKGLILGGGNNAGRATGQNVFATLICEANAPFMQRSTNPAGVPLTAEGDFEIDDILAPWASADCASPLLLIRNASGGAWFAAGIPELD